MIPEAKEPAVARALRDTFGASDFEDIRPLTAGLSTALIFRIVVRGVPYLLRLIMRDDAAADPTLHFACMKIAAEAGIAPRIWYASVEDRILVTDFVEARPFPDDLAAVIAPTLAKLHSLPNFPKAFDYLDFVDRCIQRFQVAHILPEDKTEELFRHYARVAETYPRNEADRVATHNDRKPQNLAFDGERVWLIDCEAACLNDRYADLAAVANFFVTDDAHEEAYLSAYFGEPAGEYQRARFFLMRQTIHMAYATFLMVLAAGSGTPIDPDMPVPDFRDFHRRLLAGEVSLMTGDRKLQYGVLQQYGMAHLEQALRNMRTRRFEDAVACVAATHSPRKNHTKITT